jgi:hypothetical protein
MGSNGSTVLMETPLSGGFVEKQHEIKSPAWNDKTTEVLASPSDCHKTAKIMSMKTPYRKLIIPVSYEFGIWSQIFIRVYLYLQLKC